MSMSTSISDLPGPAPEMKTIKQSSCQMQTPKKVIEKMEDIDEESIEEDDIFIEDIENFAVNKKNKKVKETFDGMDTNKFLAEFKSHLNEETIVVYILLFIATLAQSDIYTRKLLGIFRLSNMSFLSVSIIKCLLLIVIFILIKMYLLKP